jgi:membrane associated rhomboid family serine protease
VPFAQTIAPLLLGLPTTALDYCTFNGRKIDFQAMNSSAIPSADARRFRQSLIVSVSFVALLWLVYLGAALFELDLIRFGIYPRRISGLVGIAAAPLIHGSFSHLFANSVPIIVLGTALLYGYPRSAALVLGWVYAGSGLGVWLTARDAYHIGASGLTFGMMSFVFIIGAIRWDRRAIALSMLVFFLYGSMLWGIFPIDPGISFESHFYGALIGAILAFLCRHRDPAPVEKRYSWEDEAETPADEEDENAAGNGSRRLH